ncbi:hypothetical protein FV226_09525 [Methylobacterium sp. WL12]|nr:hypothetical protein [Methylobacterium sp. WL12]TXM73442.1 hypothetical protein FV226_09525 [Methylobacterium sp. WL12]
MMLLLAGLWPGSLAALVLGLAVGGFTGLPARPAIPAALGVATLALAALAIAGIVPGVQGFWLESAVAILVSYLAGCALGALARRSARVRPHDPPTS